MNSESKTHSTSSVQVCKNCSASFTITPDDFAFYEKMRVPAPENCPDCRHQRPILLTGGAGTLGQEIQKHIKCFAPTRNELDIENFVSCNEAITKYNPDIIIHAAAFTDVVGSESNKEDCWRVNVIGTENIAKASAGRRLVFISTDYVFDGKKGNYSEEDIPNPTNFYSLTKLAGELVVRQYEHTLIIRTAFKPDGKWRHDGAFADQFTSHDFVSKLAPDILRASLMTGLEGIIHIAGERKSIYDLAIRVSPEVRKMSINDVSTILPKDTSLNCTKWKKILLK